MKMLVVSDNHGNWKTVSNIITTLRDQVDYIFHCGDSEFDASDPLWDSVDAVVKGNMDYDIFPNSQTIETSHGKVYMTHGHLTKVNSNLEYLYQLAKEEGASFILYGHTHKLKAEYSDGILLLNPGSLSSSRGKYPYLTYATVEVDNKYIQVDYFNDEMIHISDLTRTYQLD